MCTHPKLLKGQLISCGCCIECRKKKVNDWALRLELERKRYGNKSLFITLTYNEANLPDGALLCKKDFQDFIKRLRRQADYHYSIKKIRYFMSGEYGDLFGRPHYHIILFGLGYSSEIINLINKCWKKGFTCIKRVDYKNCRYVAKYCVKQFQKVKYIDTYTEDGELVRNIKSEFVSMSRSQGLGYYILKGRQWNTICKDNCIKINNYSYSIPYSLKKKAKNICAIVPKRQINILYNEICQSSLDALFYYSRYLGIYNNININDVDIKVQSFSEYFKELSVGNHKEIDYCRKRNVDYSDYYINKFKYKFFLNKKFDITAYEYSQQKLFDNIIKDKRIYNMYYDLFKEFIYSNYCQLFY